MPYGPLILHTCIHITPWYYTHTFDTKKTDQRIDRKHTRARAWSATNSLSQSKACNFVIHQWNASTAAGVELFLQ